jgi:putative NADH-flavin reductase
MKLVIFGASSPTGKLLVEKALDSRHEVTAFVREAGKLGIAHERLAVLSGNALDPAKVEEAVQGQDAVLSLIGPKGKPVAITAPITENILKAMEKYGVKRFVLASVAGIPVAQDNRKGKILPALLKRVLGKAYEDRERQLALLETSTVDWTAVRVPRLVDTPGNGNVKAFFGSPSPSLKLSRAGLADFMLEQLEDGRFSRQAPILSE